jgi:hypothetical protein
VGRPGARRPARIGNSPTINIGNKAVVAGAAGWGGRRRHCPDHYHRVYWGGSSYYWGDGYLYGQSYYDGEPYYMGIQPQVGMVVPSLPAGYASTELDGNTYYIYNNTYYTRTEQDGKPVYTVAEDPLSKGKAAAATPDPYETLKAMSEFLGKQQRFAFDASDTVDTLSAGGRRAEVTTQRTFLVARPGSVRATAQGDNLDRSISYDGKMLALHDRKKKLFGRAKAPETIDAMLESVARDYGVVLPLADLLYSNLYEVVTPRTENGTYVGLHKVDGTDCHQLQFDGRYTSAQLWIEAGARPLPRKVVISYKNSPDTQRYEATISKWDLSPKPAEGEFSVAPPAGVREIPIASWTGGGAASTK